MTVTTAVLIGAGNRGRFTFGRFAFERPEELRFVALAEPLVVRRQAVGDQHGIASADRFEDWRSLLAGERRADAAVIATADTLHVEPALAALARGYDVLLEKPIALNAADCVRVVTAAEAAGRLLRIGHVLRFTPFYQRVHAIVSSGVLGELVNLDLKEHVAYWHMTHSYVRGKFRSLERAAPILLAKSCHDLDLLAWLAGRPAERVASFGRLQHFRSASAPEGSPARCTDGCPVQATCPHDAEAFYLGPDEGLARGWPWSDVSADPSREARRQALATGPYGRCVYRCDNDVVDHQGVLLEFEGGVTATLTVQGLAAEELRTLRITGTRGELRGVLQRGVLELSRQGVFGTEEISVPGSPLGHFGGDDGLIADFAAACRASGQRDGLGDGAARQALESHLIGFAAERAREEGRVVELGAVRREAGLPDAGK